MKRVRLGAKAVGVRGYKRIASAVFAIIVGLALLPSLSRTSLGFVHGLPLWLALAAAINRRRAFAILLFPLLFCLPAVLYYQHVYRMAPGVSLWLTLLNCSAAEIAQYLAGFALPLIVWAALVVLLYLVSFRYLHGPIFKKPFLRYGCLAAIFIPAISLFLSSQTGKTVIDAQTQYFRDSFPWSAISGRFAARQELDSFDDVERQVASSSNVTMERFGDSANPRTIVLVIGESARRDRHSIYGYGQPTTPVAEGAEGLIAFSNVVTLYPQTIDAVPLILAKRDRLVPSVHPSPNLVSAFKGAGFRTSWISNQAAIGPDDSPVSVYAKFADDRWFARALSRFGSIPYDEEVFSIFHSQLTANGDDKFIVVHLFGSHEDFEKRYPASSAQLPDAYDNTIRYTDSLLGRMLEDLRGTPGENALLYVSDHGLKLGECDGRSEHFDIKESYEVPLYVWASSAWRGAHPELWERAQANRSAPTTTLSVFDTLMDLGGLRYPQYQAARSLLAASPENVSRVVHTFAGSVDYDHGANNKQCHLIEARD
jgi:heptose-I-phosphate ethanolaminephosphotransferase